MADGVANQNILIVAGETSGDMLAAHVLAGLRQAGCMLTAWGVGGPALSAQGLECVASIDQLAVRGYAEVLGALPRLWHLRKTLMSEAVSRKPLLCITVDAPDFNLVLAAKMKALGIPTVHFISPSIWAWRKERLGGIKAAVDHMICVFPFEPEIYAHVGMSASYVGHPMAQAVPDQIDHAGARAQLGLNQSHIVALLPGSRASEVRYILPRMLAAAKLMLASQPDLQLILPIAAQGLRPLIEGLVASSGLKVQLTDGKAYIALSAAHVGMVASGTATLEAALYRLPMVITYAMPRSSWAMMGHKGYLPWVGLPNILANEWLVPELLQDAATPEALARETLALLADPQRCASLQVRFQQIHASLKTDTAALAARAILRMLPNHGVIL